MSVEVITREDLELFRIKLLDDLMKLVSRYVQKEELSGWIKSREARKILGNSPGTLQNLRISGQLRAKKVGGTWYYDSNQIRKLFEKGGL